MSLSSNEYAEARSRGRLNVGLVFFYWFVALGGMASAQSTLPPLEGEIAGKFTPLHVEGAPVLEWKLTLKNAAGPEHLAHLTARGAGTELRADVKLDPKGEGTWRLVEAHAELGAWADAIGAGLGDGFRDLLVRGMLRLAGEGRWRNGRPEGEVYLSVRDGWFELPAHKLVLEGVEIEFVMEDLTQMRSAPAQRISWTRGRYETLELGAGRIMFSLDGKTVQIDEGVVELLGGRVSIAAFTFSLDRPEMSFITRATGIDVARLVPLLPPFLAEANGELDGTLMLRRTAEGISFGAGELSLRQGEAAKVRLLPSPGLITDHVPPETLARVPVAGALLAQNLKRIEMGETPLRAHRFSVSLTPEGDKEGRTAVFQLAGEGVDPNIRAPINLTVNYRGPLEMLVKFSTDSRLKIGGKR